MINLSNLSDCVSCPPLGNNEQLFRNIYVTSINYVFLVTPNLIFHRYDRCTVFKIGQRLSLDKTLYKRWWLKKGAGGVKKVSINL